MPEPNSGCLLWIGSTTKKDGNGYGLLAYKGKNTTAHCLAWTLTNGSIPHGLHVLHRCDTQLCVNPDHLWIGTALDNMRDMIAKGRRRKPYSDRTHCSLGHRYVKSVGDRRRCDECRRQYKRMWRANRRATGLPSV